MLLIDINFNKIAIDVKCKWKTLMSQTNIKKNFFYSSLLTVANYVFPLIVYPYISRVLGVSNIGICNYVDSIINYFTLFAMMGINTIGIREVACNRNDEDKLSSVFSSLLLLNILFSVFVVFVLIVLVNMIDELYLYRKMMYVGVLKILFNALLVEWLYKGLEKFKYITIRTVLIKIVYVISVFVYVRSENDYYIYYIITVLSIVVNGITNLLFAYGFLGYSLIRINLKPYIKSSIALGIYSILTSMYTTFNIMYLGYICGNTEVGYYTTSTKLHSIILALFTAASGVLLPRMTSLFSEGKKEKFNLYFRKSIDALFMFSIPMVVFCMIFANHIVYWISGVGYEPAVPSLKLVMPLIFLIGYEQVLVIQILSPMKQDKYIILNAFMGSLVGVVLNIILVPKLASIGSSIVWLSSEFVVFLSAHYFVSKLTGLKFPYRKFLSYIIAYIPLTAILMIFHYYFQFEYYFVFVALFVVSIYSFLMEFYYFKNSIVIDILKKKI